jgi:hypothetical protein
MEPKHIYKHTFKSIVEGQERYTMIILLLLFISHRSKMAFK